MTQIKLWFDWIKQISLEFLFIFSIIIHFLRHSVSFHVTLIGTLNSQSSNDESRPSTHPDDYSQQQTPPKRFVNVEKYLDDSSSDSGSPLKTLHDIRYVDPILFHFVLILPRALRYFMKIMDLMENVETDTDLCSAKRRNKNIKMRPFRNISSWLALTRTNSLKKSRFRAAEIINDEWILPLT